MKKIISYSLYIVLFLVCLNCSNQKINKAMSNHIITKENGRIILAYRAFEDFLHTEERSWENYKKTVLEPYPEMAYVHNVQLEWGIIDSLKFPEDLKIYKQEDFKHFFTQYSEESLNNLYDDIIINAHKVLTPINNNPVDLCLFLPYSGCFVSSEDEKSTIYISLYINPDDVKKILIHEYAHHLHFQRRPEEVLTLRREVVSEGMAVYLTTLIDQIFELKSAIPFMPESSVEWCIEHEQEIKDSIRVELEDSDQQIFLRYISDGAIATPPKGFVQKTAYYIGYRIIQACIEKGMKIEEICSLDSESVIDQSGYFLL